VTAALLRGKAVDECPTHPDTVTKHSWALMHSTCHDGTNWSGDSPYRTRFLPPGRTQPEREAAGYLMVTSVAARPASARGLLAATLLQLPVGRQSPPAQKVIRQTVSLPATVERCPLGRGRGGISAEPGSTPALWRFALPIPRATPPGVARLSLTSHPSPHGQSHRLRQGEGQRRGDQPSPRRLRAGGVLSVRPTRPHRISPVTDDHSERYCRPACVFLSFHRTDTRSAAVASERTAAAFPCRSWVLCNPQPAEPCDVRRSVP
jgi:hypothetical protein